MYTHMLELCISVSCVAKYHEYVVQFFLAQRLSARRAFSNIPSSPGVSAVGSAAAGLVSVLYVLYAFV